MTEHGRVFLFGIVVFVETFEAWSITRLVDIVRLRAPLQERNNSLYIFETLFVGRVGWTFKMMYCAAVWKNCSWTRNHSFKKHSAFDVMVGALPQDRNNSRYTLHVPLFVSKLDWLSR